MNSEDIVIPMSILSFGVYERLYEEWVIRCAENFERRGGPRIIPPKRKWNFPPQPPPRTKRNLRFL